MKLFAPEPFILLKNNLCLKIPVLEDLAQEKGNKLKALS